MQPTSEKLLLLAHQFVAQEAYQQAVQCLLALCTTQTTELPSVLAQARLQLASLLLDHFDNLSEAKAALMTAEQDLRQMQGHHLLKCEVWDALARCHQKLGAVASEQHALAAGLKVCQQGAASKDGELLARWATRFRFKQVEHAEAHAGHEAAAASLRALGDASGALTGLDRVLSLLAAATLELAAGDPAPVGPLLEQLSPLIEEVAAAAPALHAQLRCHYSLVYVAMAAAVGRINDLSQEPGGSIALLSTLQRQLSEIDGTPWAYTWQPHPTLAALASLLHSSLLRSLGRGAAAATHLAAAAEAVEQQLAAVGFDLQATEGDLRLQALWQGRLYCHLAVAVLEQRTLSALGSARFAEAASLAAALTGLVDRFPSMLCGFVPGVLMLLGHYAHTLGQHSVAAARFRAVLADAAAEPLHDSAAAAAALAELHAGGGPAAAAAAVEALQQRGLTDLSHTLTLAVHDRTAALLANALVARRGGDDGNARVLLTKALKAAHAHLGSTQMVAQVLNVLAPIQAAKGDVAGAEQMLGSAATLAKAQGDLPTLVASSRALLAVFAGVAGDAARAAKQREYTDRKAGDLAAAVAAAVATPEHAAVLAWAPPGLA